MNAPPVNPHLADIPWTGDDVAFDVSICPAWAREVVDALPVPRHPKAFAALVVRHAALVCMCRGGDRQSGVVFDPERGGLRVYRPRDPDLAPFWDEAFRLLMAKYLDLFPSPAGAPAAGTVQLDADSTRPVRFNP